MALNDYCVALNSARAMDETLIVSTDASMPSRRARKREGVTRETYDILFDSMPVAEFALLKAEFDAIGYSGSAAFTPPAGTAGQYRFLRFSTTFIAADTVNVSATLELVRQAT